jgi:hypothetical protein
MKIQSPRQYLRDALIWSAGINWFLNLIAGWFFYHTYKTIPLQGSTSIQGDATVMIFIIIFFSLLLAVPGVKKAAKEGKLVLYPPTAPFGQPFRWLLDKGLPLAMLVTVLSCLVLVPLVVGLLNLAGIHELSMWGFLGFKSVLAALAAGLVIPPIDWLVIRNLSNQVPKI